MKQIYKYFTLLAVVLTIGVGNVWGAVESGTTYNTQSSSSMPTGWSANDGDGTTYIKLLASSHYIQTNAFCVYSFSSIKLKARQFGGPDATQKKITVEWITSSGTTKLGEISPTSNSLSDYTISSPSAVTANEEGYIKISCKGASSSKGSGVSQVTISYTSGTCGDPRTVKFNTGTGNPTLSSRTEASAGAGITLPSASDITPKCSGDGWVLYGWATSAYGSSSTTTAPTTTLAGLAGATYYPTSDNVTLYAVYKQPVGLAETAMWSEDFTGEKADAQPTGPTTGGGSKYGTASVSYTFSNSYCKVYTDANAGGASPEILCPKTDNSGYFEVTGIPTEGETSLLLTYRTNQAGLNITSSTSGVTIGSRSGSNPYTRTITLNSSSITSFELKFQMGTNSNARLDDISVTVVGTVYYWSAPTCCEPLGSIGGSVEYTDPSTAVLTWNKMSHVAASSPYTISYRTGSDDYGTTNVGAVDLTGSKATCTITGLTCNTDYDFKIAVTAASGYCDKDTTLENKKSGKWDLDYTFSGASLKDGDLDEGTGVLCGDLDITIEPLSAAYELPSDVTVTIGGDTKTKGTDYTWNSTTGELHIDEEDIDGAVAISCTATLLSCANDPSIGAVSLKPGGTFNLGQVDVTVATSGTGSATCAWTDYGFVWGESTNPTVGGSGCTKVAVGSDGSATTWNGSLTKTSFATGTTYYYRAYGKNSKDDADFAYSSSDGTFTPRSVAFNSNGGSSVSTMYVNSGGTVSAPSAPTKTGYTFDSWRTTSDLATAMNFSGTITKDTTLYAKWTANSYTLAWSSNGGDDLTGDYTKGSTDYGTTLTPPNTPTRTGYTFVKWNTATAGTGDDYTGTMPAANTTYYAQWSINNYNASITANENVTITATPSGGSTIAEGGNADIEYNKTVTLNYSSLTSGLTWGGWRVYNADDASITVTVSGTGNGATFTMPAYDVVVVAYTYGDVVAWCEPQITVTGGNYLTSTKDVYVFSDTISNLLNISSSDLGSATRIEVKYLDADNSDTEVAASSSLFRVCNDGSVNYNTAEGPYDVSASRECDLTYSIKYTPTAYNTINHYKLQLILKQGTSTVLKTMEYDMYGRSLPEEFVIAVKNTNNSKWYALPNTLAGTSGAQGAITPIEIKVDNATAPTLAAVAPTTTVYKATGRKAATKNRRGIRFTNDDSHWLQTSSAEKTYQMWLSGSSSDADQVFYLKSSDFGAYTLQMDPSQNPAKKMGIYSTNTMGYHGNPRDYAVYLLPIDTKSSPVEATVSEWSRHDALVVVDVSEIEATQVDGKLGEDESDALFTLGDAVAENTYLVRLSDDIDLSGKSGESLTLRWYDSSDELVGASTVVIPSIIGTGSEDNWSELATTPTIEDIVVVEGDIVVDEVAKAKRVIIDQLSGDGKLTINAAKALIVEETVRKLNSENFVATEVADLHIGSSSTGNGSLVMGSHDGTNKAQVDFYTKARKTAENNWVNQYIGTPFNVADGRGVKEDYYGSYLYSFDFGRQSWVNIKDEDYHFTPFLGYNIIRKDADAATLEMQGTLVATTNQSPTVDFNTDKAHSENVLANSWTAPIKIANFDATPSTGDFTNVEATIYIFNAGGAADAADKETLAGQYSTYSVGTAGSAVIPSMQSFSVYATAASPALTLNYARLVYNPAVAGIAVQPNYAPRRMKAAAVSEEMQPIRLRVSGESGYADELKIYLHEDFSDAFENGWDAHKMYGYPETPQLYAVTDDGELAILCAPDADATLLGFKAGEADTEYTFSFRYDSDEPLFLLDMQNNTYTEVQTGNAYTFQTSDVGAHNRFVLTRFAPQTPTDIEPTSDSSLKGREAATKLIIDNRIYILLRGVLYDATGRRVEGKN